MSQSMVEQRVENAESRLDTHEDILSTHDRRISTNENYRLQMQGAIKFAAFVLGSGVLTTIVLLTIGVV